MRYAGVSAIIVIFACLAVSTASAQEEWGDEASARVRGYDDALAKMQPQVEAWRRGDVLIFIREINGRKVRVLVPKQQFVDTVTALVLAGEIAPEEVPDLVRGAMAESSANGEKLVQDYAAIAAFRDRLPGAPPRPLIAGGSRPPEPPAPPTPREGWWPRPNPALGNGDPFIGYYDSDFGVVALSRDGGAYTNPPGSRLEVGVIGNLAGGWWIQKSGSRACPERHGYGRYYGRFKFVLTRDGFTGSYGYCDAEPTLPWNGRKRAAA